MAALLCASLSARLSPRTPPPRRAKAPASVARCEMGSGGSGEKGDLRVGSPVVIVETPPMLKTATAMPSLRINSGVVKQGDVGRIVSRKPKDVWAIRLAIGTYLVDGKYFKPLDV